MVVAELVEIFGMDKGRVAGESVVGVCASRRPGRDDSGGGGDATETDYQFCESVSLQGWNLDKAALARAKI